MYIFKNTWLEQQVNMAMELSLKPGMDLCAHGLNPLLHKCKKPLYPEKILQRVLK